MTEAILQIAKEMNLPKEVVEKMVRTPFKVYLNEAQSGSLRDVRLRGLGVFRLSKENKERIKKYGFIPNRQAEQTGSGSGQTGDPSIQEDLG